MQAQQIRDNVHWVGAVDWERRLFDELIPLPEGTTYNAYLVQGAEKTALVDTVDPSFAELLFQRLDHLGVTGIDYVISNHAEQDHSGSLPLVLERFPTAQVLCTAKAKGMLGDLLELPDDRVVAVEDGATVPLGGATLRFIHFPWVHWPETMVTYLEEQRLLFSCDLFGAHLATGGIFDAGTAELLPPAKRYFAEIMMPFRPQIARSLPKVEGLKLDLILPSHGPAVQEPAAMIQAYRDWVSDTPRNQAALIYTSMHDSTRRMIRHLADALVDRGVKVEVFNLATTDLGKLAVGLVDAGTVVLGSPMVLGGAHPLVAYAALLANALKPRTRFLAVIGSQGWGGKMVEQLTGLVPNLKAEVLGATLARGLPTADDLVALDDLAATIAARHAEAGLPAA